MSTQQRNQDTVTSPEVFIWETDSEQYTDDMRWIWYLVHKLEPEIKVVFTGGRVVPPQWYRAGVALKMARHATLIVSMTPNHHYAITFKVFEINESITPDSDSDDDDHIFGWAMSTQKKTSPMKKCVFVDLSQSDDETLIDIDTRSNDGSVEIITADDIRAGVCLTYGISFPPGQSSATSGAFVMSAEQRRLITTVPSASQTVMSLDEDVSPLTPLTQDTDTRPEYSARTKTTPRRSLLLEEREPVPSTEEGLEDAGQKVEDEDRELLEKLNRTLEFSELEIKRAQVCKVELDKYFHIGDNQ
jgi:hypothetical protein